MSHVIQVNGPLSSQDASILDKARRLRERAESVKAALMEAPSDSVRIDAANTLPGQFAFTGKIGPEGFTRAHARFVDHKIDSFAAHDTPDAPGQTLKFHRSTTQAIGLRSGIAAALGGVAGGLGSVAAWLLAKAITTHGNSTTFVGRGEAKLLELASRPLDIGSGILRVAERKVADPGTQDDYYALAGSAGEYEQFLFTANGTLEHDYFPPKP